MNSKTLDNNFFPKFCISCSSKTDISYLKNAIEVLGGVLLEEPFLSTDCTHLLVDQLAKTEKVLAALARAIPILDVTTYVDMSLEETQWITDEERMKEFDLGEPPQNIDQVGCRLRPSCNRVCNEI